MALKGYPLRRLDGQTPVDERQTLISAFNNGESDEFCFLLSTRAGGLGVNLTSADTVILFDHDYNPHNDLQALCRAHRIGQKNVLFIYRLVTVNSIEESIVAVARSKLVLDHVVVEQMNKIDQGEIAKILKLGVEKLFGEEKPQRIVYDEDSLKQLMDRSALPVEKESESPEEMSIFKEEVFSNARIWETEERQPGTEGDADFWAKFIPAQEGTPTKVELGKGKRKRHHVPINIYVDMYVDVYVRLISWRLEGRRRWEGMTRFGVQRMLRVLSRRRTLVDIRLRRVNFLS